MMDDVTFRLVKCRNISTVQSLFVLDSHGSNKSYNSTYYSHGNSFGSQRLVGELLFDDIEIGT